MLASASLMSFCADSEAEAVACIAEPVNATLHVGLGGSVEGAIIGEKKVVDGVRLLGLRLQSPEVEDGAAKTPSEADSDVNVSIRMAENIKLKSVGARAWPCLTPLETENGFEDSPPS